MWVWQPASHWRGLHSRGGLMVEGCSQSDLFDPAHHCIHKHLTKAVFHFDWSWKYFSGKDGFSLRHFHLRAVAFHSSGLKWRYAHNRWRCCWIYSFLMFFSVLSNVTSAQSNAHTYLTYHCFVHVGVWNSRLFFWFSCQCLWQFWL